MASNYVWIFAIVAFAFLVQSGESLRCWSCVSDQPGACGDPLNITSHHQTFHTRDCDSTANQNSYVYNEKFVCKKVVQRENGRLVVRRSCEIPGPEERDIKDGKCVAHDTTHSHVTMVSCHICSTDLCNSATSLSGSKVFLISAAVFIGSRFVPALKSFSL